MKQPATLKPYPYGPNSIAKSWVQSLTCSQKSTSIQKPDPVRDIQFSLSNQNKFNSSPPPNCEPYFLKHVFDQVIHCICPLNIPISSRHGNVKPPFYPHSSIPRSGHSTYKWVFTHMVHRYLHMLLLLSKQYFFF